MGIENQSSESSISSGSEFLLLGRIGIKIIVTINSILTWTYIPRLQKFTLVVISNSLKLKLDFTFRFERFNRCKISNYKNSNSNYSNWDFIIS